jgi:hypothetical protein
VYLRAGNAGDLWQVGGYKINFDPKRIDPKNPRHALRMETAKSVENPVGEWNNAVVTCRGDTIRVEINGQLVNEATGADISRGKILLKSEGAVIHFKDVLIKEVPRSTSPPEPAFQPLFNGKDLSNWINERNAWEWKDGTLVVDQVVNQFGRLLLYTHRAAPDLHDFELRFQAKAQGQAAVGILLRSDVSYRHEEKKEVEGLVAYVAGWRAGELRDYNGDKALFPPPSVKEALKKDQFNDYFIRYVGKRVIMQINGITCVDHEIDVDKFKSWRSAGKLAFLLDRNGVSGRVTFRDIRTRALPPPEPVFEPLFNGKDLSGWDGDPSHWTQWKEGPFVGHQKGSGDAHTPLLWSKRKWQDFELKFKAVTMRGPGYATLMLRGKIELTGRVATPAGPEIRIGGGDASLYDRFPTGVSLMARARAEAEKSLRPIYYSNDYTIRCVGNRVTVEINGIKAIDERFDWLPEEGVLAWQLLGKDVELRIENAQIRELPAAPKPVFEPLFNGKDLTGWHACAYREGDPKAAWEVTGPLLINKGSPEGYLRTTRAYENYIWKFEWRTARPDPGSKANPLLSLLLHFNGPDQFNPAATRIDLFDQVIGKVSGAIYPKLDPKATPGNASLHGKPRPRGEWNQMEIHSLNGSLAVTLNGESVLADKIEKFSGLKPAKGFIGIGATLTEMHFRNMEIKELPTDSRAPLGAASPSSSPRSP